MTTLLSRNGRLVVADGRFQPGCDPRGCCGAGACRLISRTYACDGLHAVTVPSAFAIEWEGRFSRQSPSGDFTELSRGRSGFVAGGQNVVSNAEIKAHYGIPGSWAFERAVHESSPALDAPISAFNSWSDSRFAPRMIIYTDPFDPDAETFGFGFDFVGATWQILGDYCFDDGQSSVVNSRGSLNQRSIYTQPSGGGPITETRDLVVAGVLDTAMWIPDGYTGPPPCSNFAPGPGLPVDPNITRIEGFAGRDPLRREGCCG